MLLLLFLTHFLEAKEFIPVGPARVKRSIIALPPWQVQRQEDASLGLKLQSKLLSNLQWTDLFQIAPPALFPENPQSDALKDWSASKVDLVLFANWRPIPETSEYALSVTFVELLKAKTILSRTYRFQGEKAMGAVDVLSNHLIEALTPGPGLFLTRILAVCDRTKHKEIYSMNIDGGEVRQMTHHNGLSFSPAWHPEGTHFSYSLFTLHPDGKKNIDLYEMNLQNNELRPLSRRKGINSGARYAPNGKSLALTMSFEGTPRLYQLDRETLKATPLTKGTSIDVDPTWHMKGQRLAFVSSQHQSPMIYSFELPSKQINRLTYAGRYNATPSWSPKGDRIVFAGWLDKQFDLFIMRPDGTGMERLTKNQGNNEDPEISPDGNYLVFSSSRSGQKNLYVMHIQSGTTRRISYALGHCVAPRWSLPPATGPSVTSWEATLQKQDKPTDNPQTTK